MKLRLIIVGIIIGLLLLGGAFYVGFSYGQAQVPSQFLVEGLDNQTVGEAAGVDFSLFWDAWRVIEEQYVGRKDLNRQEMVFGAISGMVKALGDPYTVFFEPQESKVFKEDVSGSFEGIGAEIGIRREILTIISPLKGSPAEAAGLRAGDKILEIDGEPTFDLSINEAVQKIRGPRGTAVILTIIRNDAEPREISVTRDTIKIPVLEWEVINNDVAHIQLFSFSENASSAFRQAVLEILRLPINKIILDLRNNPGGFLEVSQEIAGWFVNPGDVVVIEDFGDERQNREYRAIGNGALRDFKVVAIINGGSASAAEIMAGALRDLKGVTLVGAKSFGKGSIQELTNLKAGSSLKVTIARWLTPSGVSISEKGIEPDVKVELTEEDRLADRDPQFERALEIIRSQ